MDPFYVSRVPRMTDVLFMGDDHRAAEMFANGPRDIPAMDVRRGDGNFWRVIEQHPIHPTVKGLLDTAGFGGVIDCGHRNLDHGLIHALVERWRPETHTFHLANIGEATVTLQDVDVLWGLPERVFHCLAPIDLIRMKFTFKGVYSFWILHHNYQI